MTDEQGPLGPGAAAWLEDEIHREHRLIADRMGWYVSSQAFLMTAFAIAGNTGHPFVWLPRVTAIAGIAISVVVAASLWAALAALHLLRGEARRLAPSRFVAFWFSPRRDVMHRLGTLPPACLPVAFLLLWVVLFVRAGSG